MNLTARIAALAQAVGADINALNEVASSQKSGLMSSDDKTRFDSMPHIEIVSELPAQEDPDTLYLVFPT